MKAIQCTSNGVVYKNQLEVGIWRSWSNMSRHVRFINIRNEYRPIYIIIVGIKKDEIDVPFWNCHLSKKSFDGINLGNILHHKSVKYNIPPYCKGQSVHIISYVYTISIVTKIFNYKHVLHDLNIDDFKSKPPDCTCTSSPFIYNPTVHVIL